MSSRGALRNLNAALPPKPQRMPARVAPLGDLSRAERGQYLPDSRRAAEPRRQLRRPSYVQSGALNERAMRLRVQLGCLTQPARGLDVGQLARRDFVGFGPGHLSRSPRFCEAGNMLQRLGLVNLQSWGALQ